MVGGEDKVVADEPGQTKTKQEEENQKRLRTSDRGRGFRFRLGASNRRIVQTYEELCLDQKDSVKMKTTSDGLKRRKKWRMGIVTDNSRVYVSW